MKSYDLHVDVPPIYPTGLTRVVKFMSLVMRHASRRVSTVQEFD